MAAFTSWFITSFLTKSYLVTPTGFSALTPSQRKTAIGVTDDILTALPH